MKPFLTICLAGMGLLLLAPLAQAQHRHHYHGGAGFRAGHYGYGFRSNFYAAPVFAPIVYQQPLVYQQPIVVQQQPLVQQDLIQPLVQSVVQPLAIQQPVCGYSAGFSTGCGYSNFGVQRFGYGHRGAFLRR